MSIIVVRSYTNAKDIVKKAKTLNLIAIREMAAEMVKAIPHGYFGSRFIELVPIPSHDGSTTRMELVCQEITKRLPCARVRKVLIADPVPHPRHKIGRPPITFKRTGSMLHGNVVLVDDVITTGATMEAAEKAIGCPLGVTKLVYADGNQ